MPRKLSVVRVAASGQAVVTVAGIDHYLGAYQSPESRQRYQEVLTTLGQTAASPVPPPPVAIDSRAAEPEAGGLLVNELLLKYLRYAKTYYVHNGKSRSELVGIKDLTSHWGRFSPDMVCKA